MTLLGFHPLDDKPGIASSWVAVDAAVVGITLPWSCLLATVAVTGCSARKPLTSGDMFAIIFAAAAGSIVSEVFVV
jgi:hypothetical protein